MCSVHHQNIYHRYYLSFNVYSKNDCVKLKFILPVSHAKPLYPCGQAHRGGILVVQLPPFRHLGLHREPATNKQYLRIIINTLKTYKKL